MVVLNLSKLEEALEGLSEDELYEEISSALEEIVLVYDEQG